MRAFSLTGDLRFRCRAQRIAVALNEVIAKRLIGG
jgi:hypothetical protein